MNVVAVAAVTLLAAGALAGCESTGDMYDGVSRFAGNSTPFYGPGSPPREPPPKIPGLNHQGQTQDQTAVPDGQAG